MGSITLYLILALALLTGCNSGEVVISGELVGNDSGWVYLERVGTTRTERADSAELDKVGKFTLRIEEPTTEPTLYELSHDGQRIPLFIKSGDQLTIKALGRISHSYTVKGSEESELLREFYQSYITHKRHLESLANRYAEKSTPEVEREKIAAEYSEEYRETKREQLKFIIKNKSSLAAIYALFQRLPGDEHLFNATSDVIYMRDVAEAVEQNYPKSTLLRRLKNTISEAEDSLNLGSKVSYRNYPELKLHDIYGKEIALSSLDGKVIIINFWVPSQRGSALNNLELKELYKSYNKSGLEIYQVAIENSKSRWINTIHEQQLPWISVSDMRGTQSPTLGLYNVKQLPTNYLIGHNGTIAGFNLTGEELKEMVEQEIAKIK